MRVNKKGVVFLTNDDLVKAIRFEQGPDFYETVIEAERVRADTRVKLTLADIKYALEGIIEADITKDEFCYGWWDLLCNDDLSNSFIIDPIAEEAKGETIFEQISFYAPPAFPKTESDMIWTVFAGFNALSNSFEGLSYDPVAPVVQIYADMIDEFIMKPNGKLSRNTVSDNWKYGWVRSWASDPDSLDGEQLDLLRSWLDDLCDQNSEDALRWKGESLYHGDEVYEQDRAAALPVLLKYLKKNDVENAFACQMIGDIYYSGDANGGVPQYGEAVKYLAIASAAGNPEAMLRFGEMMVEGRGLPRSIEGGVQMIGGAFGKLRHEFLCGNYDSMFAEASADIGKILDEGMEGMNDPISALGFYLESRTALECRVADNDGEKTKADESLEAMLETNIADLEEQLPEFDDDELRYPEPFIMERFAESGLATVKVLSSGNKTMEIMFETSSGRPVMVTLLEFLKTLFTSHMSIRCENVQQCSFRQKDQIVEFNECWTDDNGLLHFSCDGKETGVLQAEAYVIERSEIEQIEDEFERYFSYDYLPELNLDDMSHMTDRDLEELFRKTMEDLEEDSKKE